MLTIRGPQLSDLHAQSLRRFEEDLVEHVRRHFTNHMRTLGEPQIRRVVAYALERGRGHGFTSERNLCLYLSLMLMLGGHFDVDVRLPWAAQILAEPAVPTLRIDRLTNEAMDYLDRVAGADDHDIDQALVSVRATLPVLLAEHHTLAGPWEARGEVQLRRLFPRNFGALPTSALHGIIAAARAGSDRHGIVAPRGAAVYLACVAMLGSAFDSDPLLPWAAAALATDAGPEGADRAERLYVEAMAWIDRWLARPAAEERAHG